MGFQIKRIYEPAAPGDGARVLVDRLWPRGISKERAALAEWLRDVAPSNELRKWYGHVPEKFAEFARRYKAELAGDPARRQALEHLRELGKAGRVTLLYAAKDETHNEAAVLLGILQGGETAG